MRAGAVAASAAVAINEMNKLKRKLNNNEAKNYL